MKKLFIVLVMLVAMNASGQWQPDVRLTNDPAESHISGNQAKCIASSGSVIHVVWWDYRDGINGEIYYKRSIDAGISWGTDVRITNNTALSRSPSIAVSGLVVHIVWMDRRDGNEEIYYKRSSDAGLNWGADLRLTNYTGDSGFPSIAISGSFVHIVWQDFRHGSTDEIYYKHSTDAGVSWGADIRLTNNSSYSYTPSVSVSSSVVHVVWVDNRDGNTEIYYKRSSDAGLSWGIDTRLTNNTAISEWSSVTIYGSVVHVAWEDFRDGNYEIYYKRSTDGGINWGADTRLTINTASSDFPSIAVSGLMVHIAWEDIRDGDYEIYYKRSTDAGVSWGADTPLTNNTAGSFCPSIVVSGSDVQIVWNDYRDGNGEIYYKHNPTGNLVGINNISTETPLSYSLGQNYPNPFNPTTKIKFQVANGFPIGTFENDKVVMKVYDVMGREVQTLVNETLQPGTYETTFDGSQLTSGIYYYKISVGDFSETKKMILVK